MSDVTPGAPPGTDASPKAPEPLRCDFCGKRAPRVRRIVIDREYERLQTPHAVQYACPECSEEKERRRATRG